MTLLNLTNSQVTILKVLMRNPNGLTREDLAHKSSVVCDNNVLGPVYEETLKSYPESLIGFGLVKVTKIAPDAPTLFQITETGEHYATNYSMRKRGQKDKVTPAALDAVVIKLRPTIPYGFELWTEDDLKKVRNELPEDEREVSLPSLKLQIMNRRKQGAYADNALPVWPNWYQDYRMESEFRMFAVKVLERYDNACTLNPEHTEDVKVYHRKLVDKQGESLLGRESINCGIALCAKCYKRQAKFMCAIPVSNPDDDGNDSREDEE